jgi:hypothetical protein
MKFHRMLLRIVLLTVTFCAAAWAQDTGSITGTVKDPSGASIANAEVVVSSADHGIDRRTVTNSSGDYNESGLPGGTYDVSVTAGGFKKYQAKGVVLRVAEKARVDVALQVGASSIEVTVEGAEVAQVETQSSDLTGTVTGKQVTQLELNGRNFTQLVTLAPGVSNQTGQDEGKVGVYGNVAFSMNGGRTEYNNWELDGGDNMDNGSNSTLNVYPSLEAIGEFKVLTSNYGAQYGRNGSGTVEVETKSGTKSFHGNAYEFARNDAFNARNFFQQTVPAYKKHDYGYTIGGPVYIPGLYNTDKSKTFFFWSEEWRKERVPGQTFNTNVPSLANRTGNFSDLCPSTNTPFARVDAQNNHTQFADCPGTAGAIVGGIQQYNPIITGGVLNQVPIDPNAQFLLPLIPAPNSGTFGYNASPIQPTNWREELVRVDHNFSDKVRATFRFIHDSWDTVTPVPLWTNAGNFPTVQTAFKGPGVGLVARLTAAVSPTLLNEFVFSYTADHILLTNTGNAKRPAAMTMPGIYNNGFNGSLPGIKLNGGVAYGNFGEDPGYIPNGIYNSNPTYTFRDNVSKTVGKHNLQFGAYIAAAQKNEFGGELGAGSVPGYLTFDTSVSGTTGNAFADLLVGQIASFGQQDRFVKYYNRYKIAEPYVNDDWRITDRLTLNLGLRISLFGTYREKQHQAFNFDPTKYVQGQTTVDPTLDTVKGLTANGQAPSVTNLPNGIVQCGVTAGVPAGCMQGHIFNPAPRIGFAWDPWGNGKTAIRGGYGIFYEHTNGNEGNTESLENSPPLANAAKQNQISGYNNIGGGSLAPQLPLTPSAIPTKVKWPYVQQWHFDVQHELPTHIVATLSYVGSKGTHLTRQSNLNQLQPLPLSLNPYKPGEARGSNDCSTLMTPSGVAITGQALTSLNVACGNVGSGYADSLRAYTGYGNILFLSDAASSIYHGFQTSVRRSFGGLELNLAYTYSHSIDDASSRGDNGYVDSFNPASNRASSSFDQRHSFNFGYVWDLPFFKSPGLANKVLGGWEFSGITTFSTGSPFSVLFNSDNAGVSNSLANGGNGGARPDVVSNPTSGIVQVPLQGAGPLLFNPNAFAAPRGLTFGNAPRNFLRNPNRTNFDMALFKHFAITERVGFEFRAEAYNIFNHREWGYIAGDGGSAASNSANLSSGTNTFGQANFLHILTAHNPRILQLGAKFIF